MLNFNISFAPDDSQQKQNLVLFTAQMQNEYAVIESYLIKEMEKRCNVSECLLQMLAD